MARNTYLYILITCSVTFSGVLFNFLINMDLCEIHTCPYCYGDDFCTEFSRNISLNFDSTFKLFYNLFSVKNVYFAKYGTVDVVIKKLEQNNKLKDNFNYYNNSLNSKQLYYHITNRKLLNFHICNEGTFDLLLETLKYKSTENLWTIINGNMEPAVLEIFSQENNWPVPILYGYCGRTITVENCGVPLNNFQMANWTIRAYVAYQILNGLENFMSNHQHFRFYLTDISPDNIVVNPINFKVSFIDLENGILQKRSNALNKFHYTEHIADEDYAFSVKDVCESQISDHNHYAVCRLLLSHDAPWPMMENGLLHSFPSSPTSQKLSNDIELCVNSPKRISRFQLCTEIKNYLKLLLENDLASDWRDFLN